ncbi:MFS transporter [Brevibacillus massiliensis]|jgi:putative MFS transporter|uniref:MFS transporter n=1 Tax=Brevibacillus massiliensis TaxID=1118054 RepID=UPI0002F40A9D|nr:MFS transporter [Brevibacillus massiliensis]
MVQKNGLNRYHFFLTAIAFLGWTISAVDASLFFFVAPHLMEEFNFSLEEFGIIVAFGFLISIVFNLFVGPLMDYFGRKLIFQWILFVMTIGTFLSGLAWNFSSLVIFRLLATGSAFAEYAVGATILIESVPPKHRGWIVGIMAAGWPAGTAISTLISLYVIPAWGWRSAFLIAAIPAFIIILIRLYVKEPVRYQDLYKFRNEMKHRIAQGYRTASEVSTKFKMNKEEAVKFTYLQVTRGEILKNIVFISIYISLVVVSYGLLNWFAPYWMNHAFQLDLVEATRTVGYGSLVGIFGFITCGWLSGKIGIRGANTVFICIGLLIMLWMTRFADTYASFLPAYMLWNYFGAGIWGTMPRMFTEAFPTRARGTASSISSAACWFSWAVISYLSPYISSVNGYQTAIFMAGAVLFPLALLPLWIMRRIPTANELEDYIS